MLIAAPMILAWCRWGCLEHDAYQLRNSVEFRFNVYSLAPRLEFQYSVMAPQFPKRNNPWWEDWAPGMVCRALSGLSEAAHDQMMLPWGAISSRPRRAL